MWNLRPATFVSCNARQEPPIPQLIYKISDAASWQVAMAHGRFDGSAHDVRDGFIHFSTAEQARATAAKHFTGEANLIVAAIDAGQLGPALKWEPSRGGDLFPHLYGALAPAAVVWTRPLPLGPDGQHVFPPEMV